MDGLVTAIVLAGGTGSRMGSDVPKQFLKLDGEYILSYSLRAFEKSKADRIIIAASDTYKAFIEDEIIRRFNISKFAGFASNGSERFISVKNALDATLNGDDGKRTEYVLIHDGARPFIKSELIDDMIGEVKKTGACVPAVALKDTVKLVGTDGDILSTPDRDRLRAVQTPQCFRVNIICEAYAGLSQDGSGFIPTDDASIVEKYTDYRVVVFEGDEHNIKITTPVDMDIAEIILKKYENI